MFWQKLSLRARRLYLQIAAALFTNSFFLAPVLKYLPCPSLNCYACPLAVFACPVGTWQNFLLNGMFPFFVLGFISMIGIVIGRWACGYLCPFGLLQDLLAKWGRAKVQIPSWLSFGRYFSLVILAVVLPLIWHEPWFCKLCPAGTLEAGLPIVGQAFIKAKILGRYSQFWEMAGWLFLIKLAILTAVVVASFMIKRPFCRMFCPLGAVFGLFNRISLLQIVTRGPADPKVDCRKLCPVDLDIRRHPASPDCIRCLQCTRCPGVSFHFAKEKGDRSNA
jgi:ferredoxin-type protein NapH